VDLSFKSLKIKNLKSFKAVFFDMDGVIYDSMVHHSEAWSKAFAHVGWDFSLEQVYMNEGRTGASTIHLLYQERLNRLASDIEIEAIYEKKSELFELMPKPVPISGIYELMQKVKLAGLDIYVVTGSAQETLLDDLCTEFSGLIEKEKIVSANDVKHCKPHPEPYLKALKMSGYSAEEVVVIENAPLGVESAKAAGIYTVAINTGILADEILWQSGADQVFKQADQIGNYLFPI
jgi:HAD superfamily hydrolase (TIGR01509 family)